MHILDHQQIRSVNEMVVLKTVLAHKTISRADISKSCKLNKASVSTIVTHLIEKHLIKEMGIGKSGGGRKPILLSIDPLCGYTISIDLGGDQIDVLLTLFDGTHLYRKCHPAINYDAQLLEILDQIIDTTMEHAPKTVHGCLGITFAVHGIVDQGQFRFSPFYDLSALMLEKHMMRRNIPILLENEANLSVLAEKLFLPEEATIVNISIHHGVGAGIILNNTLLVGTQGYAGEIGHTIVIPNGKRCECGNLGCLEQYASEKNLLRSYETILKKRATIDFLLQQYRENDEAAIQIIDQFIQYITIAINNLITTLNPQSIIINSSFTNENINILNKIKSSLNPRLEHRTKILQSSLKENAILYGGFFIAREHFLKQYVSSSM